jgi:hypothetical protein
MTGRGSPPMSRTATDASQTCPYRCDLTGDEAEATYQEPDRSRISREVRAMSTMSRSSSVA